MTAIATATTEAAAETITETAASTQKQAATSQQIVDQSTEQPADQPDRWTITVTGDPRQDTDTHEVTGFINLLMHIATRIPVDAA